MGDAAELRARRLAEIVRGFCDAYVLAGEVSRGLGDGTLEFARVERLVGNAEDSVLFRLKEDCHALFRSDADLPASELVAEELFDLAVGALFHEAMKLREGFYVTSRYAPRLERMRAVGTASQSILQAFAAVLESGRRRVYESAAELQNLLRETRQQLLIVLRQIGSAGPVVRALVEDPARSERVFGVGVSELLISLFGDAERAYERAVSDLLENGHFEEAGTLLARPELRSFSACQAAQPFAAAMASYYGGRFADAVTGLEGWHGAPCPHAMRAAGVLEALARSVERSQPELAARALAVAARLAQARL